MCTIAKRIVMDAMINLKVLPKLTVMSRNRENVSLSNPHISMKLLSNAAIFAAALVW